MRVNSATRLIAVKPLIVGLAVGLALFVTYSTVFSSRSAAQLQQLRADLSKQAADNARLETEIAALKARLKALSERADVREKSIRDELGYVRQDEVIFQVATP